MTFPPLVRAHAVTEIRRPRTHKGNHQRSRPGRDVSTSAAKFSGGDVGFTEAEFFGSDVSFLAAQFSGGDVDFIGAKSSAGHIDFGRATFSGGEVSFLYAEFSGGELSFGREINSMWGFEILWRQCLLHPCEVRRRSGEL